MLGTLRMDVDTCIKEYFRIAPNIFPTEPNCMVSRLTGLLWGPQLFDPEPLEEAIKKLVRTHLVDRGTEGDGTLLRFEESGDNTSPQCKVYKNAFFITTKTN